MTSSALLASVGRGATRSACSPSTTWRHMRAGRAALLIFADGSGLIDPRNGEPEGLAG